MTKHKSTSIVVSRQPALLNPSDFPEVTPLEQPALRGFIRGVISQSDPLFVAIDVVMWIKDEDYDTAKKSLAYYRSLMKKDETQLYQTLVQLKALGQDGKMRMTDLLNEEQVNRLIIELPGKKASFLKDMIARLAASRQRQLRDARFNALPDREKKYVREQMARGVDQADAMATIPERMEGIDTLAMLMAEVQKKIDHPEYWDVVNAEYIALFQTRAHELRTLLQTKSIRDALPPVQLSLIKSAELMVLEVVKQADKMTMKELLEAVDEIVSPMGVILRRASERLGVHHVTGRPLLKAGN